MNNPIVYTPAGLGRQQTADLDPQTAAGVKAMQTVMESCPGKTVMSGVMGFALGGVFGLFMASMAYDTPFHTYAPPPAAAVAAAAAKQGGTAAGARSIEGPKGSGVVTVAVKPESPRSVAGSAGPAAGEAARSTTSSTLLKSASTSKPLAPAALASSVSSSSSAAAATFLTSATTASSTTLPATAASATATATATASPAFPLTPTQITSLPWRQQITHGLRDMGTRSLSSARNFGKVGAMFAGTECCIEGYRARNDMWNGVSAGCVTGGVLAMGAGPQASLVGCVGFAAFSAAIDAYLRRPETGD